MPNGSSRRSRDWTFTLFNYTDGDEESIQDLQYRYLVYGYEICPTSGRKHLQGYIYFKNALSFSSIKRKLPETAHIEAAKGDSISNREYCTKEGSFIEKGDRPRSSKEKGEAEILRWANARTAAESGKLEDVPDDIFIRHYSNIRRIQRDFMGKPDDELDVTGVWVWGPPGVGKSHKVRLEYPDAYLKLCNKWWDGYQGEENVIIDDFDKQSRCLGHHLKIWADRYSFLAEIKGSAIHIRPKKIVITSNYSPAAIFDDDNTLLQAILRRFNIIHCPLRLY